MPLKRRPGALSIRRELQPIFYRGWLEIQLRTERERCSAVLNVFHTLPSESFNGLDATRFAQARCLKRRWSLKRNGSTSRVAGTT
jgi:hypothetical protein